MKVEFKKEQKINLINCEKIQVSEAFQNNSAQIRCSVPIKIKFLGKNPQIISIHQTGTAIKIKQAKLESYSTVKDRSSWKNGSIR